MEYIHLYMKHVGLFGSVIWIHDDIARITVYFNVQLSNPPFFPCQWFQKPGGKKNTFSPGLWLPGGWEGGRETELSLILSCYQVDMKFA